MKVQTGFFANQKRWTKVHVVQEGKPICGTKIGNNMSFQFNAQGVRLDYVECEHCKRAIPDAQIATQIALARKGKSA